jgi:geranylgeranyl pyrophosphate synthase
LHILDDIEDGDTAHDFGPHSNTSQQLNASTGLMSSASLLMRELCHRDLSEALVGELTADLHRCVLKMCEGQHDDLARLGSSLELAWEIAEKKSGAFFALACRAGARLADDDPAVLSEYNRFGHHLGMLIQIGDDWNDLRPREGKSDLARGSELTLPVAFALNVLPPERRARLRACLQAASHSTSAEAEAYAMIEAAGAELYLATLATQHREQAKAALAKACPPSTARDKLAELLTRKDTPSLC